MLYPLTAFSQCFDARYKEISFVRSHKEKRVLVVEIHFKEDYRYNIRYDHNHKNLFVSVPNSYFIKYEYENKHLLVKDMSGYTHIVVKGGKLKSFQKLKRQIRLFVTIRS